jgi:hypothetical protein
LKKCFGKHSTVKIILINAGTQIDVSEYQAFKNGYRRHGQKFYTMTLQQQQTNKHTMPCFHYWETYQHRFHFLLYIKQLVSTARCWVQFSTWIRFSLYELHVKLPKQNSTAMTIDFNNFVIFTTVQELTIAIHLSEHGLVVYGTG